MSAQSEVIEGQYALVATKSEPIAAPSSLFAPMRPADKVAYATEVANALKDVLEQRGLIKRFPNRKDPSQPPSEHVELEGWQTCATMCGVTAKVTSTTKREDGAWEATAVVVRVDNGVEVGGGEGLCSLKEKRWSYADEYAVKSMAQTRAQSRALRGVLAWVLVLAGYNPTPAEEVPPGGFDDTPPKKRAAAAVGRAVPTSELVRLANDAKVGVLGDWLETHVAPDLQDRKPKLLTVEESQQAKAMLLDIIDESQASPPEPKSADAPPSEKQRGLLFALHNDLKHTEADRHALYLGVCGKKSFKDLTSADVGKVIDAITVRP